MNAIIQIGRQFVSIASIDRYGSTFALVGQYTNAHSMVVPTTKKAKYEFLKVIAEQLNVIVDDLIILKLR